MEITTALIFQLVYWDSRNVYLEHQFITSDGCVRAVAMSRQTILSGTIAGLFKSDTTKDSLPSQPPVPSEELRAWISSMEASSQIMKSSNICAGDRGGDIDKEHQQKCNGFVER